MEITERLSRLQKQLKAPKEVNKGVSYKSRSAEQILENAKENLLDGEYIICSDEVQYVGQRYYVKATATFGFGSEKVSCDGWAHEETGSSPIKGAQLTGACSSYARKYALGGLTALDDSTDDPDKQPEGKQPVKQSEKAKPKEPTAEEKAEIEKHKPTCNLIFEAVKEAKDLKSLDMLMKVRKDDIEKFPDTLKQWLYGQADTKRGKFGAI